MTDYCQGCKVYTSGVNWVAVCSFVYRNSDGECPCSECIVKVMCNRICPALDSFYGDCNDD